MRSYQARLPSMIHGNRGSRGMILKDCPSGSHSDAEKMTVVMILWYASSSKFIIINISPFSIIKFHILCPFRFLVVFRQSLPSLLDIHHHGIVEGQIKARRREVYHLRIHLRGCRKNAFLFILKLKEGLWCLMIGSQCIQEACKDFFKDGRCIRGRNST